MKYVSTRGQAPSLPFDDVLLTGLARDGGLYVPDDTDDLRRWIYYTNEKTTFASLAGALTSAMINDIIPRTKVVIDNSSDKCIE